MPDYPCIADDITPEWLTDRFRSRGILESGSVDSVEEIGQPKADRTASNLELSHTSETEGTPPHKVFYKYNTNGRDRVANRRHCAAVREAIFYDEIDASADPIGPACYDVGGNYDEGEVYLLLEDITDSHYLVDKAESASPFGGWASFETVPVERFTETAERLATFHARWWDHPRINQADLASGAGDMLSAPMTATQAFVDRTLTSEWKNAFLVGLERRGEPDPAASCELRETAIGAWPGIYERRRNSGNRTLMHVDLHLRNVLFRNTDHRPIVIDWEGLTTGIGIIDIAHLLATSMLSPQYLKVLDEAVVTAYHDALVKAGVTSYSFEDCQTDYRLAWVALMPQAWSGDPFTRAVLHQFRQHNCADLL